MSAASRTARAQGVAMALLLGCFLPACQVSKAPSAQWPEAAKITFRIDDIGPDGLRGPRDGKVSVAYEFCVPADDRVYRQVLGIDPALAIQPAAPGRIGCHAGQALVIGETGQPRWRDSLQALSRLDYVEEIRECFFE